MYTEGMGKEYREHHHFKHVNIYTNLQLNNLQITDNCVDFLNADQGITCKIKI